MAPALSGFLVRRILWFSIIHHLSYVSTHFFLACVAQLKSNIEKSTYTSDIHVWKKESNHSQAQVLIERGTVGYFIMVGQVDHNYFWKRHRRSITPIPLICVLMKKWRVLWELFLTMGRFAIPNPLLFQWHLRWLVFLCVILWWVFYPWGRCGQFCFLSMRMLAEHHTCQISIRISASMLHHILLLSLS